MKNLILFISLLAASHAWAGCKHDYLALKAKPSNFIPASIPAFDEPLAIEDQAEPGSVTSRTPDFVTAIRGAFRSTSIDREIADHGDRTTAEALHWILEARREQARQLQEKANELTRLHPHDYQAAMLLRSLAAKLIPGEHEIRTLEAHLNKRTRDGRIVGVQRVSAHDPGTETVLNTARGSVRGPVGEALGAMLVEDIQSVGLVVMRIPGAREKIFAYEKDTGRAQHIFDSEMDLVFKGGRAWGEVKMHPYVTLAQLRQQEEARKDSRDESGKKTLLQQASEHAELGRIFNKEIHQIFIYGIEPAAAREFEKLGIVVHGVMDHPPTIEN